MSISTLHNFCEINNEMLPNVRLQDVIHEDNDDIKKYVNTDMKK